MSITIENITLKRGDKVIFNDLSLNIPEGKITGIMGPSGVGKTTLLKLITAQLTPNSGKIYIDGVDISELDRETLFQFRRKMGMLFQSSALFTDFNVFDNIAFPLRIHTKLPSNMIRDIVFMKLEAVGLRGAYNLMPSELSGGMMRRVALARAIALDPEIMLYDEPFVGQDPILVGVLVKLIKLLNSAIKVTSIVVSHDLDETTKISDHLVVIADGKVIAEGSPTKLLNAKDTEAYQFLNGEPDGPVPFHYPAKDYLTDLIGAN